MTKNWIVFNGVSIENRTSFHLIGCLIVHHTIKAADQTISKYNIFHAQTVIGKRENAMFYFKFSRWAIFGIFVRLIRKILKKSGFIDCFSPPFWERRSFLCGKQLYVRHQKSFQSLSMYSFGFLLLSYQKN